MYWCFKVLIAVKDFWLEFFEHVFAILGEFCILIKEKVFGFGNQAAYKIKSKYKKEKPKSYRQDIKRRMKHDMQRERENWSRQEDELADLMMSYGGAELDDKKLKKEKAQ